MKALVLTSPAGTIEHTETADPVATEGAAIVALRAAALNRRDFWITQGAYPNVQAPCVLGSDGAGVVEAVGAGVESSWVGREVIINPALGWGPRPDAQHESFQILGMPDNGTFAEKVAVPVTQLANKPAHLSFPEAAALPLAALTAYRALFSQGRLEPDETVLITGIGGGVATMALKFAAAAGATVLVSSSAPEKIERAIALGATAGIDYREADWAARLAAEHTIDLIIDGAAGDGFNSLLECVRPGGRIVSYGGTAGPPSKLDVRRHFWKQLHLIGSTMGSPANFAAMIGAVERDKITPEIDSVRPLSQGVETIASMSRSPQFGKLVIEIA